MQSHPRPRLVRSRAVAAVLEFQCAACGTRSIGRAAFTACPTCKGTRTEPAPWRPFSRVAH